MVTIGIVIPGVLANDYLGEVFRGAADTIKQHRAALTVNIQNPTRHDDLDHFLRACDGVVTIVPYDYRRVLEYCRKYQREYVQVDYLAEEDAESVPTVQTKNREAIQEVMQHILSLGHRRIGFITGRPEHASARQRLQGYRDSLQAAGIQHDPTLVRDGDWTRSQGYAAAKELLQLEQPPTAIVASCDQSALGAMQAAHEFGLEIGRQLSVTGFDDIKIAATVSPPLTTVRQPMYDMGKTAAEMLFMRLAGETLPELHVRLDTELIIRQSTAPAP
jgi:LacI family transcriptional regulator